MEGALPRSRPASRLPSLPHFICADLRCASPFPFRLSAPSPRVGDTPVSLLPPPSPGGVRHPGSKCRDTKRQRLKPKEKHHEHQQRRYTPHQSQAGDHPRFNQANVDLLLERLGRTVGSAYCICRRAGGQFKSRFKGGRAELGVGTSFPVRVMMSLLLLLLLLLQVQGRSPGDRFRSRASV